VAASAARPVSALLFGALLVEVEEAGQDLVVEVLGQR